MGSQIAKMGSIIVHKVDYNGVGVLRGHGRIPRTIFLTQVAPTLVSLAAVFWMSRNAPGCERDYSHPRPGSLRVYQIRFRFFIFLHYFKRLLQKLQYNNIHKSSKVKCAQ